MTPVLTISKLKRWSINYYAETAAAAERASADRQRAGGGLGEYYSEHETRTPTWLCAGDAEAAVGLVGLSDVERAGGAADTAVVARWLDDGIAPNGLSGRAFGDCGVHGFDLTFAAPKSVSLVRALRTDGVTAKAVTDAHTAAMAEAMEYLAQHAGYTRVHNPITGEKDLERLPGLVAVAYQHETSRCGDPHLHTHVLVPNRQARNDGQLVSIDGTSLYHEARAAGMIYQATLRRELHASMGFEWAPVDPGTGMAQLVGVDRQTITAWSRRSSQLREWAAHHLTLTDGGPSAEQLAAAQKATRPAKPEELSWAELTKQWQADPRGLLLDRGAFERARAQRTRGAHADAHGVFDRARLAAAAEKIEKAAFTRADLVEVLTAQLPVDTARSPREIVKGAVDDLGIRITAPRRAHHREGHERFTLDRVLAEEAEVLDLADARDDRAQLWVKDEDTAPLSAQQARAVRAIGQSPWLVQPLSAPAGAGKTTCLRAVRAAAHRRSGGKVLVVAPTGKAVDVAVREGAGDEGATIASALKRLDAGTLDVGPHITVVVDEAGMVGTDDLRRLLTATTKAGSKTILVGDPCQLAPVKARGGMFAQLCDDLPWTQRLDEVWRMQNPKERAASLGLREGDLGAIDWYRTNDRWRCGNTITMADDALAAYRNDVAAGKDSVLLCDTTEVVDALNQRVHRERTPTNAATVSLARGQRAAVGDVILTRRNAPSIELRNTHNPAAAGDSVRNGNRWQVFGLNPERNAVAARRLDDGTVAVFGGGYVREHVTLGYATTVHTAQGVTADTSHAVLGDRATRSLLYVAMTRGRHANTAYLHQPAPEAESATMQPNSVVSATRGSA